MWLLVCCLYKEVYLQFFLNLCPFDYKAVAGSGKVGPVDQAKDTSWVALVTPTDRHKSVRSRCVIELFGCVFVLSLCRFDDSIYICHTFCSTGSDLILFSFNASGQAKIRDHPLTVF